MKNINEENTVNFLECDDNIQNQIDSAYQYLEKAQSSHSSSTVVKYAKKALEIDTNMLDAKLIIIENQSKDKATHQSEIEKLLELEKNNLSKIGITEKFCR